jgi:hypothetical protein
VVFYRDASSNGIGVRHACLGRRDLSKPRSIWEVLEFEDYDQHEDDGHNVSSRPRYFCSLRFRFAYLPLRHASSQTISLGICSSDGSIHFSFDNHDTPLVYRRSLVDLTTNPREAAWSTSSFSEALNVLPGLEGIERSTFEV